MCGRGCLILNDGMRRTCLWKSRLLLQKSVRVGVFGKHLRIYKEESFGKTYEPSTHEIIDDNPGQAAYVIVCSSDSLRLHCQLRQDPDTQTKTEFAWTLYSRHELPMEFQIGPCTIVYSAEYMSAQPM
jgi:hypothetical protein